MANTWSEEDALNFFLILFLSDRLHIKENRDKYLRLLENAKVHYPDKLIIVQNNLWNPIDITELKNFKKYREINPDLFINYRILCDDFTMDSGCDMTLEEFPYPDFE